MYDDSNTFYTPCYHGQRGMTYPHSSDLCDHVPDIEGTAAYGRDYSYIPDYSHNNNAQNYYGSFYNENNDDHMCHDQAYNQCFTPTTNYDSQSMSLNSGQCPDKYIIAEEDRDPVKRIYEEISAECEHLLLKKNCEECRLKPMGNFHPVSPNVNNSSPSTNKLSINKTLDELVAGEDTTQLALSMMRKREQNKVAAARYREKKKTIIHSTKAEMQKLEKHNSELKKLVAGYQNEINDLRKKLGLPIQ